MATVLNRTTLELLTSVNTPDYDPAAWLINPDLFAVENLPRDEWVVDGDTVRPATEPEMLTIVANRLQAAKEAKCAVIDANSQTIVTSGVQVAPGILASTSLAASQNLQDILLGVMTARPNVLPITLSTTTGGVYYVPDVDTLNSVLDKFAAHKRATLIRGQQLRAQVLAATTIAEVDAVVDDRV